MGYNSDKLREWIYENLNLLNITILNDDIINNKMTIKCNECDAIKTLKIDSIYGNNHKNTKSMHGDSCSKYYNDIGRKELGETTFKKFKEHYRFAHERCCNPNCKDYKRYKGKMKFKDYVDYFKCCYEEYKKDLNKYGNDVKLTIDRIDGNKGYEKGNVRFVPLLINNRNKDTIIPVIAVNIQTLEVIKAESVNDLSEKYFEGNKASAITNAIRQNRFYNNNNNTWKIFYTYKTTE